MKFKFIAVLPLFLAAPVFAEGGLRELTPDRPDKTEGAITVDRGHFQIESDIVNWTRDSVGNVTSNQTSVLATNIKYGLTDNFDLHLIVEPINIAKVGSTSKTGVGDTTLRVKYNFWGNEDGAKSSFGLLPFIKFPTHADDLGTPGVEGGLIVPFGWNLSESFDIGAMVEFDANRNAANKDYHLDLVMSVSAGFDLGAKLGAYAEFFSDQSFESGADWVGTVDFGVTYKVCPMVQLDAGVNFGVSDAADDLNPFLGISAKF